MFYCFLADGFEEIEALATVDILKRAGIPVTTVGVGGGLIRGTHDIIVQADIPLDEFVLDGDATGVILPGGMPGVKNLFAEDRVKNAVSDAVGRGLYVCAICAAPMILGRMGVLDGKRATCYPGFESDLLGAMPCADPAVVDGKIITGKGAGCAFEFAFAIVSQVCGKEKADQIAASMQCR